MEIQGTEEEIEMVIESIARGRYLKIKDMKVRELPVDLDEDSFSVEYW